MTSIDEAADRIRTLYKRRAMSIADMMEIGRTLCVVKPMLRRCFAKWMEDNLDFSVRRGQHFMNFYRNNGKGTTSSGKYANIKILSNSPTSVVYFIQAECDVYSGPIKIGWTNKLRTRFSTLRMDNFHDLKILKIIPGDRKLESRLHQKFALLRIKGEWFKPAKILLDYIDALDEPTHLTALREEVSAISDIFT